MYAVIVSILLILKFFSVTSLSIDNILAGPFFILNAIIFFVSLDISVGRDWKKHIINKHLTEKQERRKRWETMQAEEISEEDNP